MLAGATVNPFTFVTVALTPAFALVPAEMDSPNARAMVIAIALQESELRHRKQIGGPAHGYHQFERIGCLGVLDHPATRADAIRICNTLNIIAAPSVVHDAMLWNDALSCAFARLLLWQHPDPLPDQHGCDAGWTIYTDCWKPGKPRPSAWRGNFGIAHDLMSHDGHELPTGTPRSSWGFTIPTPVGSTHESEHSR